ncbi:MAG: hypothetical protein FJ137_15980 [Deltaproteobacteria bacterium]|nr:hypothetical protein [Deltaproteobacteria bacterium]
MNSRHAVTLLGISLVVMTAGCRPGGSYDGGNERDAGPAPEPISVDDIGASCLYDPRTGENPTNQCARGLECVIVTPDGAFNPLGMTLGAFEDQFTVPLPDGTIEGYCSLVGNAAQPPTCPLGSMLKFVRSPSAGGGFAAFCVKPCSSSAECGGTRVCDTRFMDLAQGNALVSACVKPCTFDVPDCTFTGVTFVPAEGGQTLATLVDADSLTGGSVCVRSTGFCAATPSRGAGDKGAPCVTSADCAPNAACYQDELFARDRDDGGKGFCVARCRLEGNESIGCGPGAVCQPGLNFGFQFDPLAGGMIPMRNSQGQLDLSNGVCFSQCQVGNDTACNVIPDTHCDVVDGNAIGAPTVGVSMCVPDEIALQPR